MADLASKESTPSLSLTDEDHPAPLNSLNLPNGATNLKTSASATHRASFLKAAPSLMKLINVAQTPKPATLWEQESDPFPDTEDAAAPSGRGHRSAHVKMPTVLNNVLSEFNQQNDDEHEQNELQELALKAAQEFQVLSAKNDELFREKEQFRTKYDDIQHTMQELEQKLEDADVFRFENEKLQSVNGSLEIQLKVFHQEKAILEDTIDDLKGKNADIMKVMKQFELRRSSSQDSSDPATTVRSVSRTGAVSVVKTQNEERLMAQVSQMMAEKNAMEGEFERYKAEVAEKNSNISAMQSELNYNVAEVNRLTENLSQTTQKYIELEQNSTKQRRSYTRKYTLQSDAMEDEHVVKQKALEKTIEQQKRRIQELTSENQELTSEKYKRHVGKKESKKMNHIRLRTKNDIFAGGELYDMDPFGPDADDDPYFMNAAGSGLSDEDDGPTFHGIPEDDDEAAPRDSITTEERGDNEEAYIIPASHSQTASTVGGAVPINNTSCGCFRTFFGKLSSNNIQRLSDAKPLAVQEMR
eukprot:95534_1